MKTQTYSLHKISRPDHFPFSATDYSRFKFGDEDVAKQFGEALAKGFIERCLNNGSVTGQLVVISSPYAFIPTATFAMKTYFVYALNKWLAHNGLPVVQETKVHRTTTYREDYGELSAEDRMKLISKDSFHIDKQFIENKTLVFLDDIKITGSHERMIMKMVDEYQIDNPIFLLYFAELINTSINPKIENYLNYSYVKSVFDLQEIIEGPFFINTRIVKYILNSEYSSFKIFIDEQSEGFINTLFNMALGNSYHLIEAYAQNFSYLKSLLHTNSTKLITNGN